MENAIEKVFSRWDCDVYAVECGGSEQLVFVCFFSEGGELVLVEENQVTRIWVSVDGWERLFAAWQQWRQERQSEPEDSQPF